MHDEKSTLTSVLTATAESNDSIDASPAIPGLSPKSIAYSSPQSKRARAATRIKSPYAPNAGTPSEQMVRSIFDACAGVSKPSSRSGSPVGQLVGSLGAICAADAIGLELAMPSNPGHGKFDNSGDRVQITTATRWSVSLSTRGMLAKSWIVVKLDPISGAASIVFDGPAERVWKLAGEAQKHGQQRLSLTKLADPSRTPEDLQASRVFLHQRSQEILCLWINRQHQCPDHAPG